MPNLLIFDWDGTLMDSSAKITRCFQAAAADLNWPVPSSAQIKRLIGLSVSYTWQQLLPTASAPDIEQLCQRYRERWRDDYTDTSLFAGVEPGLTQLAADGYLLAVATGMSRAGLDQAMRATQLTAHFVTTRCANETRAKPHPQMLNEILAFTALQPEQAVMLGDTTFDLEMARNADVPSIGVTYGSHPAADLAALSTFPLQSTFQHLVDWIRHGGLTPPQQSQ